MLPFEALVLDDGEEAPTLLDVGPPVVYGPSVTVLSELTQRRSRFVPGGREPVLSLGNPKYSSMRMGTIRAGADGERAGRIQLTPLRYSAKEVEEVAAAFAARDMRTLKLLGTEATKANFRRQAAGRRVIHLACHGWADQSYGNFFGALALSPGPKPDDPNDNGFLTLSEIYPLDLKSCDLAILSACETNMGPEQEGEGVWSLARGFLVAGARRVVASNWVVDDEAAAVLVANFCQAIASGQGQSGSDPDYALALHKAKQTIRKNPRWQDPHFWAPFLLIGPP
jgi:CHAT domain-containing protein